MTPQAYCFTRQNGSFVALAPEDAPRSDTLPIARADIFRSRERWTDEMRQFNPTDSLARAIDILLSAPNSGQSLTVDDRDVLEAYAIGEGPRGRALRCALEAASNDHEPLPEHRSASSLLFDHFRDGVHVESLPPRSTAARTSPKDAVNAASARPSLASPNRLVQPKKRGRPRVAKAKRRGKHVRVLTTETEHGELKRAAATASMSVSTWVRAVALERARELAKKAKQEEGKQEEHGGDSD